MVVGITGSIATGKTRVSDILKEMGYEVIDADEIAHKALEINTPVYFQVVEKFGKTILNDDLTINRKSLGDIIFNDDSSKRILEGLVHPFVIKEIEEFIKNKKNQEIIFVTVPLLYEANMEKMFDYIIVVYTSLEKQIERLITRDGISDEFALTKVSNQMPLEEKKKRADFLICNETNGNDSLVIMINEILNILKEKINEI
ncbi:MAG: dephospho-CoA kinase [Bacilli bacterium]|nr:dephospho-CoA kinase [Bacilli bacterium]